MKEKEKRTAGSGGRLARCLLLTVLFMILSAGLVAVPTSETQAASTTKKTVKIKLVGSSGRYILDTGYNWWLRDKNGRSVGGFNYVKVPAGNRLKSGYYMFDNRGRLCTGKHFHKVNTTLGRKQFKGTYYFGGQNGSLYRKKGWITVGGKKYLLTP